MSHVTYKDIISHQNFKWSYKVKIVADAVEDISRKYVYIYLEIDRSKINRFVSLKCKSCYFFSKEAIAF